VCPPAGGLLRGTCVRPLLCEKWVGVGPRAVSLLRFVCPRCPVWMGWGWAPCLRCSSGVDRPPRPVKIPTKRTLGFSAIHWLAGSVSDKRDLRVYVCGGYFTFASRVSTINSCLTQGRLTGSGTGSPLTKGPESARVKPKNQDPKLGRLAGVARVDEPAQSIRSKQRCTGLLLQPVKMWAKRKCVFQEPVLPSRRPCLCCPVLEQTGSVTPFAHIEMVLIRE